MWASVGAVLQRAKWCWGIALAGWLAVAAHPATAQTETPYDPQIIQRHLVDIGGGRRLNVACVGKGSPVVVFLQGGEGSILNWRRVEQPVAAMTRVCLYDRAGFGYSDPPAEPVTAITETDDLHALLRKLHIGGPLILVGHSIGGFYATMYADRFPNEVAGLLLIDPGFAGQTQRPEEPPQQRKTELANDRRGEARLVVCASLARQGQLTLAAPHGCNHFPAPSLQAEVAYISYMLTHPYWYEAELSQSRNYAFGPGGGPSLDTRQEEAASRSFGDMPTIVLSSDNTPRDAWQDDQAHQEYVAAWRAGHDRLAARSSRGKSYVVPNSSHFIQLDRPDAVISAVAEVIKDAAAAH
jgi:pimeloyl-ACP methyl ester carboxylesterase